MATQRQTRAATESLGFLLILGGILVALNVLGLFYFGRIDTTERKLFSLSSGSKRLAGNLTDDLQVTAYFTGDLPPPFNATERYVRDVLDEYATASKRDGKIRVKFVNPDTDEEKEQAQKDGVLPVKHQVIEGDGVSVKEGYRGLVMYYGDKKEVVPVIEDTAGLEYLLTTRIKKLTGDRTRVGILGGHGEPTLTEGLASLQRCLPTYEFQEVKAAEGIPADLKALLIVGAQDPIPDAELQQINKYVMEGGSLGVFGGAIKMQLDQGMLASPADTGLEKLLGPWGVTFRRGVVADAQCGRAPLRTQFGLTVAVPHPPVPVLAFDREKPEHPVTFKLTSAPFPFTSALQVGKAPAGAKVTVLATSSKEASWLMEGESIDLAPKEPREWRQEGPGGPFPLLVAIEGKLPSAFPSNQSTPEAAPIEAPPSAPRDVRLFVAGSSFFTRDEAMPPPQEGQDCAIMSNTALALNAVDWLTQDSDLIAVRAKNVEDPLIEVPADVRTAEDTVRAAEEKAMGAAEQGDRAGAEAAVAERDQALEERKTKLAAWESKKAVYRWGNMLGIPALLAVFGVIRWQVRQRRRQNIAL